MRDASPLTEATRMPPASSARKPGEDWIALVRRSGTAEFATAFGVNPVLNSSVLNGTCAGVELVATVLAASTGGMYDTLIFTHETVDGPRSYLEWEGMALGKSVGGSTILTRNASGLLQNIQIYLRPLPMVLQFSAELAKRLRGQVSPSLFAIRD